MKSTFLCTVLSVLIVASAQAKKPDPHHYLNSLGPESCSECHEDASAVWRNAHHATSFKKMPATKDAKAMAKKLGVKRIKMSQECGVCHMSYVPKKGGKRLKAVAGVSCESCHGHAKKWNDIHHDYGGKNVTAQQESVAHKKQRLAKAQAAGFIAPANTYKMFSQCYRCHMVADEKLLNQTAHPLGDEFELVKWSNGEVRHNVWHSKGRKNVTRPIATQRVRFVLGQALALEFSLRGLAQASKEGKYAQSMQARGKQAISTLEKINGKASIKSVADMIAVANAVQWKVGQKDQLTKAADQISTLAQQFVESQDGKSLSALDGMLPKKYKGKPAV